MIFDHTHEFYDDRLCDSTIDTQPTLTLETSQDEVFADSEVPSVASVSKVDSSSSESTGTDLDSDYSEISASHRNFGHESDESDPVAMDDIDESEDDEVQVENLNHELKSLADEEKRLAVEYGMAKFDTDPRRIDSVAVFEETKRRALLSKDESANPWSVSLEKLHELRRLRTRDASGDGFEAEKPKAFPTSTGTPHRIDASRFWAVIIGIDAYKTNPLYGCVADALLMKGYLEKDLRVPSDRIQLLLGMKLLQYAEKSDNHLRVRPRSLQQKRTSCNDPSYPSRQNITKTLCSLINNPNIKKGDNIVIYFAGHGSSYGCSQCSGAVRTRKSIVPDVRASTAVYATRTQEHRHVDTFCPTEAICPIDRNLVGANGSRIPDISDRELNTILHEISRVKGNKITAIFDCCHSSGVTRGEKSGVRSVLPLNSTRDLMLRVGVDNLKRISNRTSIMEKRWRPDMSSHVILAACKEYEFAKEIEVGGSYHGYFTHRLVKALRSGSWTKELTYDGLICDLPLGPKQTPVVAGDFKLERLWYQTT
ncbi:caspase domain-containing protein [Armillaria borealis]|uniref:Caspase domain-containing protein n=1 Tax=Armillaria borealis TaxID=47425 RepID=A0AA39JAE0_9AGAR|nr:caspase domain-containing protein [Armillaria borealis]